MYSTDLTLHLNIDMCDWDGGDCCISTCVNPNGGECDNIVFDCLDPEALDYRNESVTVFVLYSVNMTTVLYIYILLLEG